MKRLLVIVVLSALSVMAQTNRGGIVGTVMDQTQAVVPGASVTVINVGTNEVRKVTTTEHGTYAVTLLSKLAR